MLKLRGLGQKKGQLLAVPHHDGRLCHKGKVSLTMTVLNGEDIEEVLERGRGETAGDAGRHPRRACPAGHPAPGPASGGAAGHDGALRRAAVPAHPGRQGNDPRQGGGRAAAGMTVYWREPGTRPGRREAADESWRPERSHGERPRTLEGTSMTEPKTHTLDAPGAVLHYDVRSNDASTEPVLLLIGSPMGAGGFVDLVGHFTDRTVVTYDPRGADRSKRTDGALQTVT